MTGWLILLGALYLALLVFATIRARENNKTASDYIFAGSNVGLTLGFLTYAASLFSTFTLLGMPDFFRNHGIGSWIFLAVSDAGMTFVIVWFGLHLRRRAAKFGFKGVAGLLTECYQSRWAGYLYFFGIFIFLVPYVAVQIRGVGIFLDAIFPDILPTWTWICIIVLGMLTYSELGGLKAIIYSDAMQGTVLFVVTSVIAYNCLKNLGGVQSIFEQVANTNIELLSVPGPEGLFTFQFLLASFLVILMVPVTQPQLTTRLVIIRDLKTLNQMALAVGIFALLLILMIIPIGLYGAVLYAEAPVMEYLRQTIIVDQSPIIAAAAVIGLIAAAMSTADSQLFALGTELKSLLSGDDEKLMLVTKFAILCFAFASFWVAVLSDNQLVLLARVSFAGTAMLAPFVILGIVMDYPQGKAIIFATGVGLFLFLGSLIGFVSPTIALVRLDLFLLVVLSIVAMASAVFNYFAQITHDS